MVGGYRPKCAAGHDYGPRRRFQIDGGRELDLVRELHGMRRVVVDGVAETYDFIAGYPDRRRKSRAESDCRDIEIAGWIVIHVAGRSNSIERETVAGSESGRGVARAVSGGIPVRWRKPVQITAPAGPMPGRCASGKRDGNCNYGRKRLADIYFAGFILYRESHTSCNLSHFKKKKGQSFTPLPPLSNYSPRLTSP